MLSLADWAACLTRQLAGQDLGEHVRRTLPFSTLTQFFAVGTNQLRAAAFSLIFDGLNSAVVFGMLPIACSAFSDRGARVVR